MSEVLGTFIEPGADCAIALSREDPAMRLLFYPDGTVRFAHTCNRGSKRGVIVCAPRLTMPNGHVVTDARTEHVTVTPSILCEDCGRHGFVTSGQWVGA